MNENDYVVNHNGNENESSMEDGQNIYVPKPTITCNVESYAVPDEITVLVNPVKPYRSTRKQQRRLFKIAITAVCCVMLMLISGFAGAKLTERRFITLLSGNEVAQVYNPVGDVFNTTKNSGNHLSNINVNPRGNTLTLTELFEGANPAVVAISTETTGRNVFGRTVTLPAAGSGFIISEEGYIVTNNHVVERATNISVLLYDGTKYPATLVGRDSTTDIAVLKIDAKDLSYLSWGNYSILKVGEQVAAIGNPLGEFANSMTVGYVSALDREINIDGTPRRMMQTDAAVNNGNSGGPLLNLRGQVIGVVSAKSGGSNVEGLGFAIPSSIAKAIVDQLISKGHTEGYGYVKSRAVMGVTIRENEENGGRNVYVESVNSGSGAEKAGVKAGDIILSANNVEIKTFEGLREILNALSPGDTMVITVRRDNKDISLSITLDEYNPSGMANSVPIEGQTPYYQYEDDSFGFPFDPRSFFP